MNDSRCPHCYKPITMLSTTTAPAKAELELRTVLTELAVRAYNEGTDDARAVRTRDAIIADLVRDVMAGRK